MIFNYTDVVRLIRSVLKQNFFSYNFEISVQNLLNVIKSKTELTRYYFQDVELLADGTFNMEQCDVMGELIDGKNAEFFQPYSIENNPLLFRYVYQVVNIFDGKDLIESSLSEYLQNLMFAFRVERVEKEYNYYKYKVMHLQNRAMNDRLYIMYIEKMPVEFYFYRKSEQASESLCIIFLNCLIPD